MPCQLKGDRTGYCCSSQSFPEVFPPRFPVLIACRKKQNQTIFQYSHFCSVNSVYANDMKNTLTMLRKKLHLAAEQWNPAFYPLNQAVPAALLFELRALCGAILHVCSGASFLASSIPFPLQQRLKGKTVACCWPLTQTN